MKKSKFPLLLILGTCLILASFSLLISYQIHLHLGVRNSQKIVQQMDKILPEKTAGDYGTYADSGMPVLEIEGVDYVAMLEVPAFGIRIPVADQWDSDKLYRSSARFLGSAYDSTLIIGGVDSPGQFSFCDKIDNGAVITVTDMAGCQFTYTVTRVDRTKHAESQWLVSADFALTLFCRDAYSLEYIAVRCLLLH